MSKRPQDKGLAMELATAGFAVRELLPGVINEQPRATYYKPDGEMMSNLPADAYSQRRYRGRGFTLTPPETPTAMSSAGVGVASEKKATSRIYVCETCGHEFTVKIALFGHKRSHTKTQEI